MENFRLTLFNGITMGVMALPLLVAIRRFSGWSYSAWPLLYYAVILGYAIAFKYSLNLYWVLAGVICALLLRFVHLKWALAVETVVFGYVLWRCLGLILLW